MFDNNVADEKARKLNIGCGHNILPDYTNLDIIDLPGVDVIHNLEEFPYPFEDDTFDKVLAAHVLEHLENTVKVMEELHRIARNGAIIKIQVPYFASYLAFKDPTHKRFFTYESFDYFLEHNPFNFYSKSRFRIVRRKLVFSSAKYAVLFKPLEWLVNLCPRVYQKCFCYLIPFNSVHIKLRVVKEVTHGS